MSAQQKVGIELATTYDGKGVEDARRGMGSLEGEVNKLQAQTRQMATAADAARGPLSRQGEAQRDLDDELTRFLAVSDKAFRAQRMLDTGNDLLNRSLEAGLITQQQHDVLLERLATKYGLVSMGVQASGQQIATLSRALATGNFEQAGSTAGALAARVSGIGVAGLAAGAGIVVAGLALASMIAHQESFDRSLNAISATIKATGREVAITRDELGDLVRDLEKLPGMNRDSALGVVGAVGGGLNEDLFRRITTLANDFAFVTGTTAPQAAAKLGEALRDPAKGVKLLADQLGVLSHEQYLSIQRFIEQGNRIGAASELLRALEERIRGTTANAMTPLQASTERMGVAWQGLMEKMGGSEPLAGARENLARIVDAASWIIDNAGRVAQGVAGMVPAWMRSDDPQDWKDRSARARKDTARDQAAETAEQRRLIEWQRGQDDQNAKVDDIIAKRLKEAEQKAKQQKEKDTREFISTSERIQRGEEEFAKDVAEAWSFVPKMEAALERRQRIENVFEGADNFQGFTLGRTTEELEQYIASLIKAKEDEDDVTEKMTLANAGFDEQGRAVEKVVDKFAALRFAIEGWGRDTSRSLAQMAVNGEFSFKKLGDAAKKLAEDLVAIQIQRNFMDPLLKGATNFIGTSLGFGGTTAIQEHSGGIAGLEGTPRYGVHPSVFRGARRFHGGGIAGDEVPIIARRGEGVFTPEQMRAMGGGGTTVRVELINQSSVPLQMEQQGPPRIDVGDVVVAVVVRDITTGGPISSAMAAARMAGRA